VSNGRAIVVASRVLDVDIPTIGEMNGDRLGRLADLDRQTVVFAQQPDLLGEVDPK
jgi:hypothetical protein